MKKQLIIIGTLSLFLLIVDQIIKLYIKSNFLTWEHYDILGEWFKLRYTENQGMAFGTKFGSQMWHKLTLSLFRLVAVCFIAYYIIREARKGVKTEYLVSISLIFTGATGNLLDSMMHDFIFPFDPCHPYSWMEGSGVYEKCDDFALNFEVRHHGFLLGSVVDMFQFDMTWPEWVPLVGGGEVFPAIWNLADACISIGVFMLLIRQKVYFPKKEKAT
ncbi:MAG: lipoprotein signal peptidase [Bacteroidetes bacterium]|nr:lipoprotein signal peptidase [Bacteroidota bacterium]